MKNPKHLILYYLKPHLCKAKVNVLLLPKPSTLTKTKTYERSAEQVLVSVMQSYWIQYINF